MSDFEGIQKYKTIILSIVLTLICLNILGPIYYYDIYLKVFLSIQYCYMIKLFYYVVMTSIATYKALEVIRKVQTQRNQIKNENNFSKSILHAIVLPIYQQSLQILQETLKRLAEHQRSKHQYLVFLALQEHSESPRQRALKLKQQFQEHFKLIHYTIHKLKPGEAKGKASNQNFCLQNMEDVFFQNSINPDKVLFTTIDSDNWAPEAYFDEVERFLSKNQWKMDNFMFAPGQMFTINSREVPILNRCMDNFMGSTLFAWSNNLTKVQNAASNYSLSFNRLKKQNFFDTNPDAMCDDFHNSLKTIWKSNGEVKIIPIFVLFNMISLSTGKGYLTDTNARFWQAERHMRAMLDAAYSFNLLFKSKFNFRTFWATISYFQNHFIPLGLYLTAFIFFTFKLFNRIQFTYYQLQLLNIQTVLMGTISLLYYLVLRRSSQIFYKQKPGSVKLLVQILLLYKIAALVFVVFPQLIATIRITLQEPTYDAAAKAIKSEK